MSKLDAGRVAAVFAADTALKFGTGFASKRYSHLHKFAYALGVQTCKRVAFVKLRAVIAGKEYACDVTAEAAGQRRKVVGTRGGFQSSCPLDISSWTWQP